MSDLYAEIIVNIMAIDADRTFSYRVPEELKDRIDIGMQVRVPFGKGNRLIDGFVIGFTLDPGVEEERIKDIGGIINAELMVETTLIKLAYMICDRYGVPMISALKTVIPVKKQVKEVISRKYAVCTEPETALARLEELKRDKRMSARVRALSWLIERGETEGSFMRSVLKVPDSSVKALIREGIVSEEVSGIYRDPVKNISDKRTVTELNDEQKAALERIEGAPGQVHLLHGVTGSGKTEVYMALIEKVLAKGRQAIVLIPEISLTYQTVSRFCAKFGNRVSIMNSRLSQGERYDQYLRAKRGD
ncbi:MAG: DEAD/DEAH box helicase family protein, partial [Lachnospiraceae bacterium]|nr:DEAD/DEAH box helicase family protein [Lachnospiraceae bacterium]